ncbi:Oidioi.mRNA.OKI2018_I69.chr2.g8342.t1.cds [Oikopleura dioica]|uniref:Oidioi.mRNA.OKI2018_I69.chr2.g8342.t1.cds n=1 Tax=Oikopleura dioica TaxID=34765 RepID=A0ABN7TDJ3_OIKDI|nr:Oidioi.mRNA.OKI2018_I69.chr2.g8342.t1.cds [Oikopleura dioica]
MSSARVVKSIKYPIENAFVEKLTKQNTTESSADSFLSRPSRVISSSQSSVCSDDFPCLAEEISSFKNETSSIEAGRVNNNSYIQMEVGQFTTPKKAQESVTFESETTRQTTNINRPEDITPRRVKPGTELAEALSRIENAQTKPVAFAVRANIFFYGVPCDDCPASGNQVTFEARDYIHIKEKYSTDWWIGRLVREGCELGFVPSAAKLEQIRAGKGKKNPLRAGADGNENVGQKKKAFFRRGQSLINPYDVVPNSRPIVLVGPSLKGYEVTDMMQKVIFDFLKRHFQDRIHITRVTADLSLSKRQNPGVERLQRKMLDKNHQRCTLAEVEQEIDRIFELASGLQLLVLDADAANLPSQLAKTSLAPLIVYLKVTNQEVLRRLIKSRGKTQSKFMNTQMLVAEKLANCSPDSFDVILDENQLSDACEHLGEYLEAYWRATHPLEK